MRPEQLRQGGETTVKEITRQSDILRGKNNDFASRRERVQQVRNSALSAVYDITALCGGRPAPEQLPPGVRSTGTVILDRCQTPEGVPFLVVGRIDVKHPLLDGRIPDLTTVETASVHMGVAPEEMPFGAEGDEYRGSVHTALDGNQYYVEWKRGESTDCSELKDYTDADLLVGDDLMRATGVRLGSLHESINIIRTAADNPELNGSYA